MTQDFAHLVRTLPHFARGAARIIEDMMDGRSGADVQEAVRQFDKIELRTMAVRWINYIDPYKAPEQVYPCADAIVAHFIKEEENAKS